ncbi:unnamed protein product, partial [Choristocarpus tenellus]
MRANSNSAPGPDGMRPSHTRSAITTDVGHKEVAEAFEKLQELAYTSLDSLPLEFWTLHTNSRLSAIGEKCRPVACVFFFRRAYASAFCTDRRPYLEEFFGGVGQFGVRVPNGVECVLLDIR